MLPKSFQQQNIVKKNKLTSRMKLYTITYDYDLTKYYAEYVKESYNRWGNVVDYLGIMKLTGYNIEESEFNFIQLIKFNYIDTHKISRYKILDISEELIYDKFVT